MSSPHFELIPLLIKHDITWEMFSLRGRPPKGVREKRVAIVTHLHESGKTWREMVEVTGLSNGSIQRLTLAKGCFASRNRLKECGEKTGRAWKGKKRPGQLERQWASGVFDHLRGTPLSAERVQALKDTWSPERRASSGEIIKRVVWGDPVVRAGLLAFHRSDAERARRSCLQSFRMQESPQKYVRGKGCYVDAVKEPRGRFWVRSSYERAAVLLLESDVSVQSYFYEKAFDVQCRRILPDFLVQRSGGWTLVEVKASWVFEWDSNQKVLERLQLSRDLARWEGWTFEIWTEEELHDFL